jgi:hypothetical protein
VQLSSNLVPRNSRIKVEKKVSGWTGHIWSKPGHVCRTFSAAMFDACFERNFITVSSIGLILLLLAL